MRNMAADLGIREVRQQGNSLILYQKKLDLELGGRLSAALRGRVMVSAGQKPYIAIRIPAGQTNLDALREALEAVTPHTSEETPASV